MRYALTCPGQGLVRARLLGPYAQYRRHFQHVLDEADSALGYKISERLFNADDDWLMATAHAQPAIVTATVAVAEIWRRGFGLDLVTNAHCILGHSLGEYTAWVLAGKMSLATAVQMVRLRGTLLQDLRLQNYTMMALLFKPDQFDSVYEVCSSAGIVANINSSLQLVVSGPKPVVASAVEMLTSPTRRVLKATPLAVRIPFHSSALRDIEPSIHEFVAKHQHELRDAHTTVVCNLTAEPSNSIADTISANSRPVLWKQSMDKCVLEVTHVLNLGPGSILHAINAKWLPPAVNIRADIDNHRQVCDALFSILT